MLGKRLKQLRIQSNLTQKQLAEKMNIASSTISMYEAGRRDPDTDTLLNFSKVFNVSVDYLLGKSSIENNSNSWKPQLNSKDERDIQKKIQSILDDLDNPEDSLMYNGEPLELDEMTKELLRASMENGLRIAKIKSKEKYTPNKYR